MYPSGLRADWVRKLAETTQFEFRGTLTEIGFHYRRIDDRYVIVDTNTQIIGEETIGATVECQAVTNAADVLLATIIRVVPPGQEARIAGSILAMQTEADGTAAWEVLVDPTDPTGNPTVVRVKVDQNTWVDQSRSVAAPDKWVEVRGTSIQPEVYQADVVRVENSAPPSAVQAIAAQQTTEASAMPWGAPTTILPSEGDPEHPVMAFTTDRAAHAVWESNNRLYYANRPSGRAWSAPVMIAYGFAPDMVAGTDGTLHIAFANRMFGNYDTYYIACRNGSWTLPTNMAYTSGFSTKPKLGFTANHTLQAVWMDNTPGYWTTYYATWDGTFWSNRPIPSGRGQAPALGTTPDGAIYVVWQDRVTRDQYELGDFDIFVAELYGGTWTSPLDIVDDRNADSIGVDITTTADNLGHIVWTDNESAVRYSYGQGTSWALPRLVSNASGYASDARILSEAGKYLHIAWEEEGDNEGQNAIRAVSGRGYETDWSFSDVIIGDSAYRDVALAAIPTGGVSLSWVEICDATGASIRASIREPMKDGRIWLPAIYSAVESGR
jgi:hypothetical protein